MRAMTAAPPPDMDQQYKTLRTGLGVKKVQATLGSVTKKGGHATAPFTASLTLPMGTWRYQGRLSLATDHREWKVGWSPESIHPDLHSGQHLTTSYRWPQRARVVAANGTAIDGTNVSGSVQGLVGSAAPLTEKQASGSTRRITRATSSGSRAFSSGSTSAWPDPLGVGHRGRRLEPHGQDRRRLPRQTRP